MLKNAVSKGQISSRISSTNGKSSKEAKINAGTPAKQVSALKK